MPAGPQLAHFRFPRKNFGYRGEHATEGLTDEIFEKGYLYRCRNYHLVGRGRLLKRQGTQLNNTTAVNGANPVNGLSLYDFGSTRHLIALCNGKIKKRNSATAWDDITGSTAPGSGQDNLARFAQFRQGGSGFIIGTGPDNTRLWRYSGTGNAEVLAGQQNPSPLYAKDIVEFKGRLFAIGTDTTDGEVAVQGTDEAYSDRWTELFYCDRNSDGMGLARHGRDTMLVFHRKSVHRVHYDYAAGLLWARRPVTEDLGAIATGSIITHRNVTYFASDDGFYRIRDPQRGVEFLGDPMRDVWKGLNQDRLQYIQAFKSVVWNEVGFWVSNGSDSEHKHCVVWNPDLEGWTLFDSSSGYLEANCATDWIDADGEHVTVLGRTDGLVHDAFGDDGHTTGNRDGDDSGAAIATEAMSGFMDLGWIGLKRTRQIWIDVTVQDARLFTFRLLGASDSPSTSTTALIGASGDRLSVDFVFNTSVFASKNNPTQGRIKKSARARLFQWSLTEATVGAPHTLNALTFLFLPQGLRMKKAS